MIKKSTTLTLLLITSSALAQTRNNSAIDICLDYEVQAKQSTINYEQYGTRISELTRTVSNMNRNIISRTNALDAKRSQLYANESKLRSLTNKQANKARLISQNTNAKNNASRDLPSAEAALVAADKKKDDECGLLGSLFDKGCRRAKRTYEATKKNRDRLSSALQNAKSELRILAQIDQLVLKATRALESASLAYQSEEARLPSQESLNRELSELRSQLRDLNRGIEPVRDDMILAKEKASVCHELEYQALKAPMFKKLVIKYMNLDNCVDYKDDLRRARGPEARDAITEAYEIVCENN